MLFSKKRTNRVNEKRIIHCWHGHPAQCLSESPTQCQINLSYTANPTRTFEALCTRLNKKSSTLNKAYISITALLVKVISWVILQFPMLNSSLQSHQLHLFKLVNLGMAVALKDSLIVLVVHNAEQMGLAEIATKVKDLSR